MASLAKPAAEAARTGELNFYPDSWKKTYLYWLDNIQDWCISRQLWWGHRIPIWYCQSCSHVMTGLEDPNSCSECQSRELKQDEDVLDTWFSSWLWPLSPFGWPDPDEEKRLDFDYYYPSNVLITAGEIIFLWVARMVMAGLKFKNQIPFKDIYFSAVVTDKKGRKFSKTLGNGIDPIEVIDRHGADAVRFTGVSLAPLSGRIHMDVNDFDAGGRFINKLWNASRMVLRYCDPDMSLPSLTQCELDLPSKWLLSKLHHTTSAINNSLENYRLNDAVDKIYHFIWDDFCDWALETAKDALADDSQKKQETLSVLIYTLDQALRLAHPVMPFVTEELWQKLPAHPDCKREKSIVISCFPETKSIPVYPTELSSWQSVQSLISAIRSTRQQVDLSPKQKLQAKVKAADELVAVFKESESWVTRLANLSEIDVATTVDRPEQSLVAVGKDFECFLPAAGLIDFDKERARLNAERERLSKLVAGLEKKLSNKQFVDKAPTDIVANTRKQKQNLEQQLSTVESSLKGLG